MFHRIFVPLDGSPRAERALPVAAQLARISGGSVLLVRVCTTLYNYSWGGMEAALSSFEETVKTERTLAADYLASIVTSGVLKGIDVVPIIAEGSPALHIISEAEDHDANIIVMCSHGDTGLKRWLMGSVAQKVTRYSSIPVLILREGTDDTGNLSELGTRSVPIIVSLDGSPLAEKALLPAAYLSAALSAPFPAELRLLQVLPLVQWWKDTTRYVAHQAVAYDEDREDVIAAQAYLTSVAQRLCEGELATMPLEISTRVALASDVAGMIVDVAQGETEVKGEYAGDLIAMATHGHGGFRRWLLGTITERVLSATHLPLLVIRPPHEATESEQHEKSGAKHEAAESGQQEKSGAKQKEAS